MRAIEAQSSVIGSLLISPDCAGPVFEALREEDFTDPTMRTLFAAARALWLERRPVDPVTLVSRVGEEYVQTLADVMNRTPTAANVLEYAGIVRQAALLARLRETALGILDADSAEEAQALLRGAEGLLTARDAKVFSYREMTQRFLERMNDDAPPDYLDWGFPQLNEQVSISKGRFVILAAESSVGKTAFALQLATGIARGGTRVGFFSLETSDQDAMDRVMAQTTDVSLPMIKKKRLGDAQRKALAAEIERSWELPLDLIEAAGWTADEIRAETLARRYEVIFIDYVQLVQAKGEEPSQQVRAISMALHTMSQQLGVTVIGLSQVTPPPKDQKGRRAELSKHNLRESHQLIHDAEAILILDLTDINDYSSNRILKVDKNKDGPCGRMLLRWDAPHMKFTYIPPAEDDASRAARERNEVMDRNRAARAEKAARKQAARDAQESAFRELEGGREGLPF